jgi:hypothetical protein
MNHAWYFGQAIEVIYFTYIPFSLIHWYNCKQSIYTYFTQIPSWFSRVYEESYLKNDCFHERYRTEMYIESIDAVTSYFHDQQSLKFAVMVLNLCGEPIDKSEVELVISAPDGSKRTLSQFTDSEGVALFELLEIDRGRWEAVVFRIEHPDFSESQSNHNQRWSITYV